MMKTCILVMMVISVGVCSDPSSTKNHNGEEHRALCDVLKAAANKWESVKDSESPMKKALKKTIFGENSGYIDISSRLQMPADYNPPNNDGKQKPNTRKHWCGACGTGSQNHHPGESAPHDLLCICTPGQLAYPLNGANNVSTLCGQNRSTWESSESGINGWYTGWEGGEKDNGREHTKNTWLKIVQNCLEGEGSYNLKSVLTKFTNKVRESSERRIGEVKSDCDGKVGYGVCVLYPQDCEKKSWWYQLEEAIHAHEKWEADQTKLETEKKQNSKSFEVTEAKQISVKTPSQNPQPTTSVSQSPQTEETQEPPRAEQVISNMNATIEEESSTIIYPFWLLLVFLYN
ncbi:Variant surface glycoprotein [Trypanosoma congolense IL3000]|uniref:Variant surface glycoprotein n=1 Tax=Trypanosoma congolense (strain IL3000) TaxID=1068625 RepID=F9W5Y7_TRYCI|nr:Variant surface glycoprotein [Trypanosoma congolense IL3000]